MTSSKKTELEKEKLDNTCGSTRTKAKEKS